MPIIGLYFYLMLAFSPTFNSLNCKTYKNEYIFKIFAISNPFWVYGIEFL